ncbi:MAG: 30S ribosomal protein S18 [Acidimicrobiaceae bacterium]|nr:30S ribosomal protein S18 [Acidimicrobiaceae bacterium]|tara:strand:+ start:2937 stop:3431 length:495 start_codon:yes stop_codon:yes gene_type:complete
MARRPPRRTKPRDNRRGRRKVSALTIAKVEYVDYKDTELLNKFVSDRAKIRGRRVNSNDARQQREVAKAVKNAREMALIPFTNRVTTQRRERRADERGGHSDGPPSRPSMPPPGSGAEDAIAEDAMESVDEAMLPEDVTFEAAEESPAGDEPIAVGGDESEELS